jgi:hypothetical protein
VRYVIIVLIWKPVFMFANNVNVHSSLRNIAARDLNGKDYLYFMTYADYICPLCFYYMSNNKQEVKTYKITNMRNYLPKATSGRVSHRPRVNMFTEVNGLLGLLIKVCQLINQFSPSPHCSNMLHNQYQMLVFHLTIECSGK